MKRITKAICLILLLSLVASVFAVFPAFAEEVSELKPVTVLDLDSMSQTSIKMENSAQVERDGATVTSPSITKKTDESGEVYWLIETNVKAGETIGDGDGSFITTLYPKSSVVVKSGSTGSSGKNATKNTDFMVIDFDVATDDVFIDYLQFHMRYANATGGTSQDGNGYPTVKGSSYSELYVLSHKDKVNKYNRYSSEMLVDEWVDITFVYDFRGETQSNWKCYAYINGYFAGTLSSTDANSYYLQWLRLSVPYTATHDYESTKLRNLTYTKYPVGWSGDLTAGKIGVHAITLEHIDDLAYCVEDKSAPRFDGKTAIATIERVGVDEPINVCDVYDLDANFVDGDKVTLLCNIDMPLFVNANNVEFVTNGYRLDKVDTSTITGGAADFDWSTVGFVGLDTRTRAYVKHGTADEFTEKALPSSTPTVYIMLSDMVYDSATSYKINGMYTVFDLNGYTLDLHANDRIYGTAATQGNNGIIRWQNGTLLYQGKRDITNTAAQHAIVFQNLDSFNIAPRSGVLIDHRCALVVFKDIDSLTSTSSVVNISSNASACGVVYDGVTISTTKTITDMNNRATTSANQYLTIRNSNITVNGANIITGYTRSACPDNNLNIIVDGSTLTTDNNFFRYQVTTTAIDTTDIENNIRITNSTINADRVVYIENSTNAATYLYNADVKVDGASKLNLENAFITNKNEHAGISADFAVADGVKIAGNVANVPTWVDLTLGDGNSVIAGVADANYSYIVTDDFTKYSYTKADGSVGTIDWYNKSEIDYTKFDGIEALKESTNTALYNYAYRVKDNAIVQVVQPTFGFSANLTLYSDICLNVFIPVQDVEGFSEALFSIKDKDGVALTEGKDYILSDYNMNGKDYYKLQILGISPMNADETYTVVATFAEGVFAPKDISVVDYLEVANEKGDEKTKTLAKTIFTYLKAINPDIKGNVPTVESVGAEYTAPESAGTGISVSLALTDDFAWIFEGMAGKIVTVKYNTIDGGEMERTFKGVTNGSIVLKACDLLGEVEVTVVDGENTVTTTLSFVNYAGALIEAGLYDKATLDAIYDYALVAQNFKKPQAA